MERKSKATEEGMNIPKIEKEPTKKTVPKKLPTEIIPKKEDAPVVIMDDRILWKNYGRGSRRMVGRIIKPNERFLARPDQIPTAFRDVIRPADPSEVVTNNKLVRKPTVAVKKPKYNLRSADEKGKFHIVNEAGKIITEEDSPVDEATGKKIIRDLESN